MRYKRLVLVLPLLGMMKKCEPEPVPPLSLPPATQVGANTLGFSIDGRVWRNYGWLPYTSGESDNLRGTYSNRHSHAFNLSAGQIGGDIHQTFDLSIDSLMRAGTYQASRNMGAGAGLRALRGLGFNDKSTGVSIGYGSFPKGEGTITITLLDTVQHVIAGTFSGILRQPLDSTKKVAITEGRFDVRYQ